MFSFGGVHKLSTCLSPRVGSANRTVNCSSGLGETLFGTLRTSNVGIRGCNAILTAVTSGSGRRTLPLVEHFCGLNFGVRTARNATGFLHRGNVEAETLGGVDRNSGRLLSTVHSNCVTCMVGAHSLNSGTVGSNRRVHRATASGGISVFASLSAMDMLLSILRRAALAVSAVST